MVGAGSAPDRQPSDWNGWPLSVTAVSIALTQATRIRGSSSSGSSITAVSSHAVSMVASRNSSLAASARRKPTLVVSPRIAVASSAATSASPGVLAGRAVHDHLAEHRVVRRAHDLLRLERVVDPHVGG